LAKYYFEFSHWWSQLPPGAPLLWKYYINRQWKFMFSSISFMWDVIASVVLPHRGLLPVNNSQKFCGQWYEIWFIKFVWVLYSPDDRWSVPHPS
jgi:hypothetical protein